MAENFERGSQFSLDFGGVNPFVLRKRLKWGALVVGLILLFVLLSLLRSIYTDWLWYGELGFRSVFIKVLVTRIVLFVLGGVIFGVLAGISLYFANRVSQGTEQIPLPQATSDFLRRFIKWGAVAAAAVLSAIFGALVAGEWQVFLRFESAVSFGATEPVYNKDVSFYVFSLPLYDFIQGWFLGAAIVILLATLALYFVNFSMRGVGILITPGVRVQVSIIAAAIMLILGLGHWLDRWGLLLSDRGLVFGAAYTELHALKPALLILTIISIASAVLILVNAYMRGIRLLIGAVVLWIVMAIVLGIAWPNVVQRFTVNPNEFVKELPYIERNIEFTRKGFGLGDVAERLYPADPTLTAEMVRDNPETIDNIRLWDHGPLSDVYKQIQLIRPYYDFKDADVDRYVVDGRYRQVMLAAREVAQEKLDPEAQTWVNERLRYTHGFGIAMSPVTEFTPEGRPEFFARDIPPDGVYTIQSKSPVGEPDTIISNPRIYYGEKTTEYVIVNTKTDELDYQAEGGELRSIKYYGVGGVSLGSFIRRLAYTWQMGDINILITGETTADSRIQYRREIQERISTIVPFLHLDKDPYLVAAEGALFWIQDAYTLSDRYPYSDPNPGGIDIGRFNYIRNSVKVTVDAFNGTVRFYVVDPADPLIQTYQSIFPKLFTPLDAMPLSLRAHLRYPQDMFGFQAGKYLKYHMLVPQDFYNLEDIWSIPSEKFGQKRGDLQPVDPYYVIMKVPGEEREEFVLLLPFTRNEPPIMAGWLAARNDGEAYGELVAFTFPKDRQVDSPEQIEAKIDNDEYISQWQTLRCVEGSGSTCIRGNLLVIPLAVGDAFGLLYAEPLYLLAEGVEFPELKQVILATQEKVVMEASVSEAIKSLTGFSRAATPTTVDAQQPAPAETVAPADSVRAGIESLADAIEELKKGLSGLEEALEQLNELVGDQ